MVIIRLKGGLGNQMFQYAFGKALSMKRKEPLFLDTSIFGNEPKIDTPRSYALDVYNINAKIADQATIAKYNTKGMVLLRKIKRRLFRLNDYSFHPSLTKSKSTYFEGYWNNQKYFESISSEIRHDFTLKNKLTEPAEKKYHEIINLKTTKTKSVSLHIRRGDYISNPYAFEQHCILSIDYYKDALNFLTSKISKDNLKIYIFSDDMNWVKKNLILTEFDVEYMPQMHDYEEMYLMSLCDHNIIANSSFSWWGAWLNKNAEKIVIAPKKWVKNPYINTNDVCPPSWIRI